MSKNPMLHFTLNYYIKKLIWQKQKFELSVNSVLSVNYVFYL